MVLPLLRCKTQITYELCLVLGEKCDVIVHPNKNILDCEAKCTLCQCMAFFQLVLSKPLSACFLFIRMWTIIFGEVKVIQVNLFESCFTSSRLPTIHDDDILEYCCI